MLRLLPSHESYRAVDGSIADPVELDEAERHLQYPVQGESFNTERRDLLDNKSVKRSSRIAQFNPFIGPHGLIRSSGRLRRLVEIDFVTKHPLVLVARHIFVELFLRHTHLKNHQGIDYLRSKVQESYAKRWGFLFTCLTTRAVHVEVVPSMNTSSCVMRMERFASRRGTPAMIWSDNGRNFIGAEKEFLDCIEKWNPLNIAAVLAHKDIEWRFNPPSAPHQGGIWERLVRSFRRVLYTILRTRRFKDEVLKTTFCLVEHAVNARPLAPVSADPSDLGAKKPNRFLLDNQVTGTPSIAGVDDFDHRKRYARAQSDSNAIWARVLKEYLR